MESGISLCIPYQYQGRISLYRIADFADGRYSVVDPSKLTELTAEFNPRYLRYRPGELPPYYVPTVRRWQAVLKNGDLDKSTTETFYHYSATFYEIVLNPEYMGPDNDHAISCLRNGIELPAGVAEDFFLVIDEDEESYRTLLCKKNYFRFNNGKYFLDKKLDDILHARHSLDVYYINKEDILSTKEFSYFFTETGQKAPVRYFYAFDYLPEQDGTLYLFKFDEYLPVYISRYLRSHAAELDLNKNSIQTLVAAVRIALRDEAEQDTFFAVAGYQREVFEQALTKYETAIINHIDGSGFLNEIITKILSSSPDLAEHYISIAKSIWLDQADEERSAIEEKLAETTAQYSKIKTDIDELERTHAILLDEYEVLKNRHHEITSSIESAIHGIENKIGEHLVNAALYRTLTPAVNEPQSVNVGNCGNVIVRYERSCAQEGAYYPPDISKACRAFQSNLKLAGMNTYCALVLSHLFIGTDKSYRSAILSGIYARTIADAFAFSIDGHRAARITISASPVNYAEVLHNVSEINSTVILVENLLDTYNEAIYVSLNKDFPEKIFLFSADDDSSITMLSRSIWNYSLLINTDLFVSHASTKPQFKAVVLDNNLVRNEFFGNTDNYHEFMATMAQLGLPITARHKLASAASYLYDECGNVDPSKYLDSVIAKYCQLYAASTDPEALEAAISKLPDDIKKVYHF